MKGGITMNDVIGKNIKLLREANKFTQENVAAFLDIPRSTYSMYELGEREIPLNHTEKLSELFGCELKDFFEEDVLSLDSVLSCAFRVDNLDNNDLDQIARFKGIVRNYLKMKRLIQSHGIK